MNHEIDLKKFNIHTDMAMDKFKNKKGLKINIKSIDDIKITDIILNKSKGFYTSIEYEDITDYENYNKVKKMFIKKLKETLKKNDINRNKACLIVGLGNEKSTPDSLGTKVTNNILVTRHLKKISKLSKNYMSVATLMPKVSAQTGISSFEIIDAVVKKINPDFLIVIDSLVTNSVDRLLKTIQIDNVGINAGSGVGSHNKEISLKTLNIPVVAIGVPTVLCSDNLMVTIKEIDYLIEKTAMLIATSINYLIENN